MSGTAQKLSLFGVVAMALFVRRACRNRLVRSRTVSSARLASTRPYSLRAVHWNVFEDGLNQAPRTIGFSSEFARKLDILLEVLAEDGAGGQYMGFKPVRDFALVPPAWPINSTSRFFGFIDVVYSAFYHDMGGELRRGSDENAPHLRMSLRTLFLHSIVDENGTWDTPEFESELSKALTPFPAEQEWVRKVKSEVFDASQGALV